MLLLTYMNCSPVLLAVEALAWSPMPGPPLQGNACTPTREPQREPGRYVTTTNNMSWSSVCVGCSSCGPLGLPMSTGLRTSGSTSSCPTSRAIHVPGRSMSPGTRHRGTPGVLHRTRCRLPWQPRRCCSARPGVDGQGSCDATRRHQCRYVMLLMWCCPCLLSDTCDTATPVAEQSSNYLCTNDMCASRQQGRGTNAAVVAYTLHTSR